MSDVTRSGSFCKHQRPVCPHCEAESRASPLRVAAQEALDVLEGDFGHADAPFFHATSRAMTVLRSALSAPAPTTEPWYEADGSVTMLPAEEVTRRRKLAAVTLKEARVLLRRSGETGHLSRERTVLQAAFDDLDGLLLPEPPPAPPEDAAARPLCTSCLHPAHFGPCSQPRPHPEYAPASERTPGPPTVHCCLATYRAAGGQTDGRPCPYHDAEGPGLPTVDECERIAYGRGWREAMERLARASGRKP